MKLVIKILILILFMIGMLRASAQVVIKPSTAQYYLETEDERDVYVKKDSVNTIQIKVLDETIAAKDSVISTYKNDSSLYIQERVLMLTDISKKDKEIKHLTRKIIFNRVVDGLVLLGTLILLL